MKQNTSKQTKQKIPLSTSTRSDLSNSKNDVFNNFSDFKRNKPLLNFTVQNKNKTEKSEINLNSTISQNIRKKEIMINELTTNIQTKDLAIIKNKSTQSNKNQFYLIERIYKYLKTKLDQNLYEEIKDFLINELKNFDENGDLKLRTIETQISSSSITDILSQHIKTSRNSRPIETSSSVQNSLKVQIPNQLNLRIGSNERKELFVNPPETAKKITNSEKIANSNGSYSAINTQNNINKILPVSIQTIKTNSGNQKHLISKPYFSEENNPKPEKQEVKATLFNDYKKINQIKDKRSLAKTSNSNSNAKNFSKTKIVELIYSNSNEKKHMSDTSKKTIEGQKSSNSNSKVNDKSKKNLQKPNEISINLREVDFSKEKNNRELNLKEKSSSHEKTSLVKLNQETIENKKLEEKKIEITKNIFNNDIAREFMIKNNLTKEQIISQNLLQNEDFLKEVKLSLDDNLKHFFNFSYDNFFNKEHNESGFTNKESFNDLNIDYLHTSIENQAIQKE